jgi:hypothetical protein
VALLKSIDEKLGQRVAKAAEVVGGRDVVPAVTAPQTSVPADADRQFEKWLVTRDPPLVNLTAGERAYYRQSWNLRTLKGSETCPSTAQTNFDSIVCCREYPY